jgi:hypothetical protein
VTLCTMSNRPGEWWKLSHAQRFVWCQQNLQRVQVDLHGNDPGYLVRVITLDQAEFWIVHSVSTYRPGGTCGWAGRFMPGDCKPVSIA